MIYELLLIAVIAALARKGKFKSLLGAEIKFPLLIVFSFFVQVSAMGLYDKVRLIQISFPLWIVLSYLILVYTGWQNRKLPGFMLFGAGMCLNFLAIALNDGRMPVSIDALEWAGLSTYIQPLMEGMTKHQPLTETTFFPFLADIVPLRPPFALSARVVSVGDIAMTLGICRFFYKGMIGSRQGSLQFWGAGKRSEGVRGI